MEERFNLQADPRQAEQLAQDLQRSLAVFRANGPRPTLVAEDMVPSDPWHKVQHVLLQKRVDVGTFGD
jgi:hypothetical protein